MSMNRDQYLADLWKSLLDYIIANRILEPEIINHFYEPCSLYELTDEKAIILAPNVVSKQILKSQSGIISDALIDVLNLDHSLIVEIYQKSELPSHTELTRPIPLYDESDFLSMPIQKDRTFDNFVVGDCNKETQPRQILQSALYLRKFRPRQNTSADVNRQLCAQSRSEQESLLYRIPEIR